MQQFYADAFLALPPKVMGRQLVPFSMGHWYLLLACNSPFIVGGSLTIRDIIFAVWVCSQPAGMPTGDGARIKILDGSFQKDVEEWGKIFDPEQYESDRDKVLDYIRVYTSFPPRGEYKTTEEGAGRRSCKVPYPLAIVWRIAGVVGLNEAWSMPAVQALAYHAAACDADGDQSLTSEEEEQAVEAALAELAKAEGQSNGKQS